LRFGAIGRIDVVYHSPRREAAKVTANDDTQQSAAAAAARPGLVRHQSVALFSAAVPAANRLQIDDSYVFLSLTPETAFPRTFSLENFVPDTLNSESTAAGNRR